MYTFFLFLGLPLSVPGHLLPILLASVPHWHFQNQTFLLSFLKKLHTAFSNKKRAFCNYFPIRLITLYYEIQRNSIDDYVFEPVFG